MKSISLLGSTGSIGRSTLDVVGSAPGEFSVAALAAGRNIALLEEQIHRFRPRLVSVIDEEHARELRRRLSRDTATSVCFGPEGYREAAAVPGADMVVSAMVGAAGLLPTLEAIRSGRTIALANKETLVMAGDIVLARAEEKGVSIIPVDSEHSAIFQCLQGNRRADVRRIILTASGGPFLRIPKQELEAVAPDQALKHPNWMMGKKITIDSATMMNKGLEAIEAQWLFGIPMTAIDVLIHPQSIVHSLVEYQDGSVMAQLGVPDMRIPIAYALAFPRRLHRQSVPSLDLAKAGVLEFLQPDKERFPCLEMAYGAAQIGGTMPAAMNGANECAVQAFIDAKIGFNDIYRLTKKVLDRHIVHHQPTIDTILDADGWARAEVEKIVTEMRQ